MSKKLFKIIACVLSLCCFMTGCGGKTGKSEDDGSTIDNPYFDKGMILTEKIYEDFWSESAGRFMGYDPEEVPPYINTGEPRNGTAFLWPYGAAMTTLGTALKADPGNKYLRAQAEKLVENLEQYRAPTSKYRIYAPSIGGGGTQYYDDNAWLSLALYDMGTATENQEYLDLGEEILKYVLSGQITKGEAEGAVYWDNLHNRTNVCSNGPAIITALLYYNVTKTAEKKAEYLAAAKKIYAWTVENLRNDDGVYWDGYNLDNDTGNFTSRDSRYFSYNCGLMMWAGMLLYNITEETSYLDDVEFTAEGADWQFYTVISDTIAYYPPTPWFNLYLLQGYIAYAEHTKDFKYVNQFIKNLDLAWSVGRDARGYVNPCWRGGYTEPAYQYVSLLDQTGTAENLFLISYWQETILPNLT